MGVARPRFRRVTSSTRGDEQILAGGLGELEEEHCVLYVALTRAKELCVALGEPG